MIVLHALCMHFNKVEMLRPTIKGLVPLGDYHLQRPLHASTQTPGTRPSSQRSRKPHSRSKSCIAVWSNAGTIHTLTAGCRSNQETDELFIMLNGTTQYCQLRAGGNAGVAMVIGFGSHLDGQQRRSSQACCAFVASCRCCHPFSASH